MGESSSTAPIRERVVYLLRRGGARGEWFDLREIETAILDVDPGHVRGTLNELIGEGVVAYHDIRAQYRYVPRVASDAAAESKLDVYKRLTLDLLGGVGEQSMHYVNIYWEHYECDGLVDQVALRQALNELVSEGKVARVGADEYRWMPPQEGESPADKVKRLEAERDSALADKAFLSREYDRTRGEWLDYLSEIERALRLRDGESALDAARRIRVEQSADRAAVKALVSAIPRCEHRDGCEATATGGVWDSHRGDCGDGYLCDAHRCEDFEDATYAAPLRALQALMATWPSDRGRPGAEAARSEEKARKRDAFREMARRCGDPGTSMLVVGTGLPQSDEDDCQAGSDSPAHLERISAEALADPDAVERDRARMRDVLRSASEKVAAWPEYLHSDDAKRRRREFGERMKRLNAEAEARNTFSFTMPEDGIVRASFNSDTGEATATHLSPRFVGERPLPVTYPHRKPRYIGEFGDIDEPSVGDVDGYGRRR